MSLYVPELNATFDDKKSMFSAIKSNESRLISIKKKSIVKDKVCTTLFDKDAVKNNLEAGYVYPIISVTNLFDSHRDVHFKGSMTKTAKEQQGKVVYALDHDLSIEKIIAWEDEIDMFLKEYTMSDLGYKGDNRTLEGLTFKIKEEVFLNSGINAVKRIIESRKAIQNSIRMVYYKLKIGINSEEKDLKENKEYYESRINDIYNKDEVEEVGYFYGVEELGIKDEGSMVVRPSQQSAITLYGEPSNDTRKTIEPSNDTQKELELFYKTLLKN